MGKPDYIIVENGIVIPIEAKPRSKTPNFSYLNHRMQLMAYCYLVEENYGARPPEGILRYSEKEFRLKYTEEERQAIIRVVNEITEYKRSKKEFFCSHKDHN